MPRGPFWSARDKKTLCEHYPYISSKKLTEAFPGRSARAITSLANRHLGLRKAQDRLREMGRENRSGCPPPPDSSSPHSAA